MSQSRSQGLFRFWKRPWERVFDVAQMYIASRPAFQWHDNNKARRTNKDGGHSARVTTTKTSGSWVRVRTAKIPGIVWKGQNSSANMTQHFRCWVPDCRNIRRSKLRGRRVTFIQFVRYVAFKGIPGTFTVLIRTQVPTRFARPPGFPELSQTFLYTAPLIEPNF